MNWYVQIGTEQRGPLRSDELKQLVAIGSVVESTPIKQGQAGKWSTAGKVKGLQFSVADPPPLPAIVPKLNVRKCPFCAEEINAEAIKCKHCGEFLTKNSEKAKDVLHGLEWSNDDLTQLIKRQKKLIVAFISGELLCLFPIWPLLFSQAGFLAVIMAMILRIWWAFVAYKLADLLYPRTLPKVFAVVSILLPIPLLASIAMLVVNDKATKLLKEKGIAVNLMGADLAAVKARQQGD